MIYIFIILLLIVITAAIVFLSTDSSKPEPWTQTLFVNEKLATKLIEQQTNLKVETIKHFGSGWDNIAYLINHNYVFRFPTRQMGIDFMENEILILPYLKKYLDFNFSCPTFIGKKSNIYPVHFSGYPLIDGSSLSELDASLIKDRNIATKLAFWLKSLHSIPINEDFRPLIKGNKDIIYDVSQRLSKSKLGIYHSKCFFTEAGFNIDDLIYCIDKLQKLNFNDIEKKSYVHGDLYSRHLIFKDTKDLAGIIDWGDVHIGNPGYDLSII